jgi:hypothetical protein
MRLSSLAAACALLATATPAAAQITVTGIRNLAFGPVIRGVALHVLPSDAVKSGQFRFVTAIGNVVRISFTLPNRLNGPANLPISFSTTDAIALGNGPTSVPVTFNPNTTNTFTVVSSTTINVFLGGTVTPSNTQAFGSYTNTITITVTVQ